MKAKSKKASAIFLAAVIFIAALPLCAWAASAPALISAEVEKDNVLVNDNVIFHIVTDTSATKIKISNQDGTTYLIADIDAGFGNYTDADGQRLWTVTKKAQFCGAVTKTVYAGSTMYGYGVKKIKVSFGSYFTEDDFTDIETPSVRGMEGSFLQSWLVRDWSQQRWEEELSGMEEAGMEYLIIQSVADVAYKTDGSAYGQDYSRYPKDYAVSMYPSQLPALSGTNNGIDSLDRCLSAAQAHGIKVFLGPVSDNRWWLFGWGMPNAPAGVTNLAKDSYFAAWVRENAELTDSVMEEISAKYSAKYGDTLAGWYYYNEIWNIDVACAGTDGGVYADILSDSMNRMIGKINELDSSKKFMLSPFYNTTLCNAVQYGNMWEAVIKKTDFRPGDIFAPQDSIGGYPQNVENGALEEWTKELHRALLANPNVSFWSNNEIFTDGGGVALLDRYIRQLEITSQYAEHNICFSWNHYYSPKQVNAGYNKTYLDYLANGELDSQPPAKPVLSKSGYTVQISGASDNIGVCGYYIYQGSMSTQPATIVCDAAGLPSSYSPYTSGTYYVVAFDFANNKSEAATITL